MTRDLWIREKLEEAEKLQGIATNAIVPSGRDFTQFLASQRTDVALVARLKRVDPSTGGEWRDADLVSLAELLDDTELAALAVSTAAVHGMSPQDLDSVRAVSTAPLMRDDLCVDEVQLYDSRLRGADAVRIPVTELVDELVESLCDVAVSLHMTPVLDIADRAELERAPVRAPHCVGLRCTEPDGFIDVERTRALAALVPRHIVVVSLSEPRDLAEASRLRGSVDGAFVGDVLLRASEPEREIERFLA